MMVVVVVVGMESSKGPGPQQQSNKQIKLH